MHTHDEVLFETISGNGGNLGVMTLNRPAVLNSLHHNMVLAMHAQLKVWATDTNIKAVVIRAVEGRAFCAGGDIRSTYDHMRKHDMSIVNFFRDEYQLNRCIYHFPKPYIALLDGITMGGGVGISIHGSHRVATDRLVFAMPETGIGFFPDVGGTYFLPRLPGYTGYYLGLTGARIKIDDCVMLGIMQHKVQQSALPHLLDALTEEKFGNNAHDSVTDIINQFHVPVTIAPLMEYQKLIDECFSLQTMEDILLALQSQSNEFATEAIKSFASKSPTSLKVTLRALQVGRQLDFDACMQQEFRLATRFLLGHDFLEGIRAVIIDKDQTPHWQPANVEEVKNNMVEDYFSPLAKELV